MVSAPFYVKVGILFLVVPKKVWQWCLLLWTLLLVAEQLTMYSDVNI